MGIWGLLRYRLFDIVPVARDKVMEVIGDGVVVLDTQDRVVDVNAAAREILRTSQRAIGQQAADALYAWPQLLALCREPAAAHADLTLEIGVLERFFGVSMAPLVDRKGTPTGRVLTFRDRTDRKHAQAQLLQQQRTQAILEERERLEREIAELLHSRVQSKLLVARPE